MPVIWECFIILLLFNPLVPDTIPEYRREGAKESMMEVKVSLAISHLVPVGIRNSKKQQENASERVIEQ